MSTQIFESYIMRSKSSVILLSVPVIENKAIRFIGNNYGLGCNIRVLYLLAYPKPNIIIHKLDFSEIKSSLRVNPRFKNIFPFRILAKSVQYLRHEGLTNVVSYKNNKKPCL